MSLSTFLSSELVTLLTVRVSDLTAFSAALRQADLTFAASLYLQAQLHHLDILPRPNRTGHGYDPGDWSRLPAEWQVWFDSAESADDLQVKLDDIRLGIDRTYSGQKSHNPTEGRSRIRRSNSPVPGRPTSLSTFLEATRALPLPRDVAHPGPTNTNVRPSGMSVKKAHEVAHFIDLVSRIARERGVRRIIVRTCHSLGKGFTLTQSPSNRTSVPGKGCVPVRRL